VNKSLLPFLKENRTHKSSSSKTTSSNIDFSTLEAPKLSKEEIENIRNSCTDEHIQMMKYFEEKSSEQQNRENLILFCTIISAISGVGAFILSIIQFFNR